MGINAVKDTILQGLTATFIFGLLIYFADGKQAINIVKLLLFLVCYVSVISLIKYTKKRHQL